MRSAGAVGGGHLPASVRGEVTVKSTSAGGEEEEEEFSGGSVIDATGIGTSCLPALGFLWEDSPRRARRERRERGKARVREKGCHVYEIHEVDAFVCQCPQAGA